MIKHIRIMTLLLVLMYFICSCRASEAGTDIVTNDSVDSDITETAVMENNGEDISIPSDAINENSTVKDSDPENKMDSETGIGTTNQSGSFPAPDLQTWNGLDPNNEYDDFVFEYIAIDTSLPFEIRLTADSNTISYNNIRYSYESSETPPVLYESFIPRIDIKSLDYSLEIYLKRSAEDTSQNKYFFVIWNDEGTLFRGPISNIPEPTGAEINGFYSFALFINEKLAYVGQYSFFMEINNKVFPSCDYIEINDDSKYDASDGILKAESNGYYKIAVIPNNYSLNETDLFPVYIVEYLAAGAYLPEEIYKENSTVFIIKPISS